MCCLGISQHGGESAWNSPAVFLWQMYAVIMLSVYSFLYNNFLFHILYNLMWLDMLEENIPLLANFVLTRQERKKVGNLTLTWHSWRPTSLLCIFLKTPTKPPTQKKPPKVLFRINNFSGNFLFDFIRHKPGRREEEKKKSLDTHGAVGSLGLQILHREL